MSSTVTSVKTEAISQSRHITLAKAKRWSTLLAKFVSVQLIVQAFGFVTGLLLVRALSQREYAYYTIANTMQATLLLLADVGVGSALSATGGHVWQDKRRFSELIRTGLHVRKSLAWISGAVAVPLLAWLLFSNGVAVLYGSIMVVVVLVGASFRLTNDVLTMVPKLHARIDQLQKLDVVAGTFRLVAIGIACCTFINAAIGLLVSSLSFGLQYLLLKRWVVADVDLQVNINADDKRAIFKVIRQQAPSTIYYCVQGQLIIFLSSIFANTHIIAEVGALGRLAIVFAILGSIMNNIFMPRFARCQDKSRLKAMWWQIMMSYAFLSMMLMSLAIVLPKPFLWLLGRHYSHLGHDLGYVIFSTIVTTIVGAIYSLNATRGWTRDAWLAIPIVLIMQVLLFHFLDLSTIRGIALMSSLPFIPSTLPYLHRTYKSIKELNVSTLQEPGLA